MGGSAQTSSPSPLVNLHVIPTHRPPQALQGVSDSRQKAPVRLLKICGESVDGVLRSVELLSVVDDEFQIRHDLGQLQLGETKQTASINCQQGERGLLQGVRARNVELCFMAVAKKSADDGGSGLNQRSIAVRKGHQFCPNTDQGHQHGPAQVTASTTDDRGISCNHEDTTKSIFRNNFSHIWGRTRHCAQMAIATEFEQVNQATFLCNLLCMSCTSALQLKEHQGSGMRLYAPCRKEAMKCEPQRAYAH